MKNTKIEHSINKGNLILVNKSHPYKEKNQLELIPISNNKNGISLNANAATVFNYMMQDMHYQEKIIPVSGYRTLEEQRNIFYQTMKAHGEIYTRKYVALPGCSEHQTGYAIDLAWKSGDEDFICPDFPTEGICEDFRQRASFYGYIERYPKGKEEITGIEYEPWHFRYVGYPHFEIMKKAGMTLEEYIVYIRAYRFEENDLKIEQYNKCIEVGYLKGDEEWKLDSLGECLSQVSGNNVDGYIITRWRK